jgi:ribosomal protein L37E
MRKLPNLKLYKECQKCKNMSFGQFDAYCSQCGNQLKDYEEWIASIGDYAKSLLINFLDFYPDLAKEVCISEIPDYATEWIRANGNILFDQKATRRILAECWNEVETALDDWRESNGGEYPIRNIEQLHVFSVVRHAEMVWRETVCDLQEDRLDDGTIALAVDRLKSD